MYTWKRRGKRKLLNKQDLAKEEIYGNCKPFKPFSLGGITRSYIQYDTRRGLNSRC
jgi:hypothetical protein